MEKNSKELLVKAGVEVAEWVKNIIKEKMDERKDRKNDSKGNSETK